MKALLLSLLGLSSIASARISETPEECAKRYGSVVEKWEDGTWVKYAKGMVRVECTFHESKCVVIEYSLASVGGFITSYDERFDDNVRSKLMIANQGGSRFVPWQPAETAAGFSVECFKTEDGKHQAFLYPNRLRFEVAEYIARRLAGIAPAEVKKVVEGF